MNPEKKAFYLLITLLLLVSLCIDVWGNEPEPIEGRITQINEKRGTITINGQTLDASDFELSDLQVGYWVMGEFIREKGKLRLIDLEVIK
ncbi:MAG: hypothetical protein A2Y79_13335 [Deltaproteobacteria bacterium RBG_13_43_22]|nr:MAG: hypothetical protein A2Y79_13335 [Deltaproteobacteria bacterium RBG_13_43_22]